MGLYNETFEILVFRRGNIYGAKSGCGVALRQEIGQTT